jgi:hypothetical protein
MVYTHYYGWLVIGVEFLFLLLKRRRRASAYGVAVLGLVVASVPWLMAVARMARTKGGLGANLGWNTRPTVRDFFQYYTTLNGPIYNSFRPFALVFSSLLFLLPLCVWAWNARKDWRLRSTSVSTKCEGALIDREILLLVLLLAFLPAVAAFLASYVLPQAVWGPRFLVIVAPAYLLLISIAAAKLPSRPIRGAAMGLMVLWAALSGTMQLTHRDKIDWRPPIAGMIQSQAAEMQPANVYTNQGVTENTIRYYLNQNGEPRLQVRTTDRYDNLRDSSFWIAFIRYQHETGPMPYEIFVDQGDEVDPVIRADAAGHSLVLARVKRRGGGAFSAAPDQH